MIEAILSMGGMALVAGIGLGYASIKFHVESDPIVDKLEEALPGTQCGNCGFPGCKPYAEAVASGTPINLCAPGGAGTMKSLADLLGVEPQAMGADEGPKVALIDEDACIGCTACIKPCPVDAILGANKQAHTILTKECTGCEACVKPCPVDCITMVSKPASIDSWLWDKPQDSDAVH